LALRGGAARPHPGSEVLADAVRDQKLCILRPTIAAFGEANLLLPKRVAMSRGGVMLVGRAVADMGVEDDQRRTTLPFPKNAPRLLDAIQIVSIAHAQHVPAVPQKPPGDILPKTQLRRPFEPHPVVSVDPP